MFSNEKFIGEVEKEIINKGWIFYIEVCILYIYVIDDFIFECY